MRSIFLFKVKNAYEMRSRDLSSDVCSSDLCRAPSCCIKVRNKLSVPGPEEKHRCANVTIMLIFGFAYAGNIASGGHLRHGAQDSNEKDRQMTKNWQPHRWRSHEARQLPT